MTAATQTQPATSAGMEVDYGYEDTGIDYGYGDASPAEKEPPPSEAPPQQQQPSGGRRQRRLSAFVGVNANNPLPPLDVGGGDNNNQAAGGGGGGGGQRRRGRRLSMFAFAGQENDMEEFNTNGAKEEASTNSKTNPKNSKGLMRKLSDDIGGGSSHGSGVLGSFFRGGGAGGNEDPAASKGPTRRRGRRLSMIAFDGGDNNLSAEEQSTNIASKSNNNGGSSAPDGSSVGVASHRRQNTRGGSSYTSNKTGSSDAESIKRSKYYPPVELPAEYLADASFNKPVTRTMGLSRSGASYASNMSAQHFQSQQKQQQQTPSVAGGETSRPPGRAQRRSSFGGTTATGTMTSASTDEPQSPRRYTLGGASPEQAPKKFFSRNLPSAPSLKGQTSKKSHNSTTGAVQSRNGIHPKGNSASNHNRTALSQSQHSKGALSHSQHGKSQLKTSVAKKSGAKSLQTTSLDQSAHRLSPTQSPRSQRRTIGRLAVQGIPETSTHKVTVPSEWSTSQESNEEGVIEEETDLQSYMNSMDVSSHSVHGGGASVSGSVNISSGASVGSTSTSNYRKEVAAMAREARAAAAAGVECGPHNMSLLYILARCCDWSAVLEEVQFSPRDAKVVSEKDGTTALHLAVMSRTNPMMRDGKAGEPAPLEVIEALVQACPEAAIIRCSKKRYTPLCYACLVADVNYDMEDCARIVECLIKHAPHCPFVFTDDGFSALDIHILSYSQLHKHKEVQEKGRRPSSTRVLETLLHGEPSLADARVYRNKIRGPLELLYRCNIDEFKEAVEKQEEIESSEGHDQQRIEAVLTDWWAWKWTLMLLKCASISAGQDVPPFKAVHAAARLVGCPLPVLALSVNTYPKQVTERDPTGDIYNLPLHEVCSWRADSENIAGDPFIATRKFKAMRMLLEQFPEAARMTNNCGETPLQLAVETCTPWHGGLEALVEACPKALKFPRKLRITDNGLALAVANHSAIDSLATVDSDEPDPLEAIENMYPFLVAAVLGGVSRNKLRPPVSFSDQMAKEHYANLERKDLQAVRSVYGLLRARPEVLAKYRQYATQSSGH